jgi:hypothetical protein
MQSATISANTLATTTGPLPASPVSLNGRMMPTRIPASLRTVRTVRGAHGSRQLIARLTTSEPVSVRSRLTRGKRLIGGARNEVNAGTHEVRLSVAADARGGSGKLTVVLTDQAGHRRTLTRPVTVPAAD